MKYRLLIVLITIGALSAAVLTTGEEINWQVISAGGTSGTSTNYALKGTLGQTAVGCGSSPSFGLSHGFWTGMAAGAGVNEITLDTLSSPVGGDTVAVNQPVRWYFRLTYTPGDGSAITGSTNGFRVWTYANGVANYTDNFDSINYGFCAQPWPVWYAGGTYLSPFGVDGLGEDTIGFGGFMGAGGIGIPDGVNDTVWWVETTPTQTGDTLCIDSSWYPPGNPWIWSTNGPLGSFQPGWDGPHCFVVGTPVRDAVVCEPQGGLKDHPPFYWYDVTPGAGGLCDFHVKVHDSVPANYRHWVEPTGWQHQVHKVSGDWWASWWDPTGSNAIDSAFRFQFDNGSPSTWSDWRTTMGGTSDPFNLVFDSAGNHTAEPDGYGKRVHVPIVRDPLDTAIVLDTIHNIKPDGKIPAGPELKLMMRWTYSAGIPIVSFANGFRTYSPDGATWQPIVFDTVSLSWMSMFDVGFFTGCVSCNGVGADTVYAGGVKIFGSGLVAPFDSQVWWIETKVFEVDIGKHLCLDSSWFPPAGTWLWNTGTGNLAPDWSGPHCFEIAPCCNHDGIRGDVNYDFEGPNVADLTSLVNHLFFNTFDPPCFDEADVNCDGSVNVADLTYLVDYLFVAGPQPEPCDCPKRSGAAGKAAGGISLKAACEDGMTVISLESPVDLKGIQIELSGAKAGEPIKLVEDDLELFFHQEGDAARIGILDMQGSALIQKGSHPLARLPGELEIVEALVSDLEHNALVPNINPTAKGASLPDRFVLRQNYPNPFNPTTEIGFTLPTANHVTLEVYNILGQRVAVLVDGYREAGEHVVQWESKDANGQQLSSGVYLYRLEAGEFLDTKKMLLLK